ncbi:hypothetical protein CRUP_010327 [Coryphaenoides rupestris]|nr:hypothetical protein CRUP_010327 [Coryphaenoides rupestris]
MSVVCDDEVVKRWESEQASLRQQVVAEDTEAWQRCPDFSSLERVGGVDLSFIKGDDVNACAQLVVLSYPDLEVLYEDSQMVALCAPYVAGFLAFRETPFLLDALQRLQSKQPQLLPQVQGVTKSQEHQSQIAALLQKGGDSFPLTTASGKVLGKALRSSDSSTKPVYVSVGHKISLETAVRLTHSCCRYRVPEPIRQADIRSREYLRIRFPPADTSTSTDEGPGVGTQEDQAGEQ